MFEATCGTTDFPELCPDCRAAKTWRKTGKGKAAKRELVCETCQPLAKPEPAVMTASALKSRCSSKGARRKGQRGELEVKKLHEGIGWACKPQPSSGAFGTRINEERLVGDLVASTGSVRQQLEVKRRKEGPKVLIDWMGSCDELWIRADNGEWFVFAKAETHLHLKALAGEAARGR